MLKSFMLNQEGVCADFKTIGRSEVTIVLVSRADSFFFLSYFWHVETFFFYFFFIHPFYPFLVLMWDCVTGPAL